MQTLAQRDGYTWSSQRWLNREASYHRMVYEDRESLYTPWEVGQLLRSMAEEFTRSTRSRLVIRTLLTATEQELTSHIADIRNEWWQVCYYRDHTPGSSIGYLYYMTYSKNKSERSISTHRTQELTELNQAYIERTLKHIDSQDDFHSVQLDRFHRRGFYLTRDIHHRELAQLWTPFGWSEEACERLLWDAWDDCVLGVRAHSRELVASILYSHQPHTLEDGTTIQHWELTEANTAEAYRGNGIMGVLATALHVTALNRWVHNIYGEYRALSSVHPHAIQSLRFALESGVRFGVWDILLNHVDVDDVVDEHNHGRQIDGYWPHADKFKNFILWSLDPDTLSPHVRALYLSSIS